MSPHITSAIIIGGGIAGPAAAIALRALNITCTIYEARATPSTLGGAIGITPVAVRSLAQWGLLSQALDAGHSYTHVELFSLASGKSLGKLQFGDRERFGQDALRIGRAELQRLLLEGAVRAGAQVRYGKKLVGVREDPLDESITAIFEDGEQASADLLLGCDGIHSLVRGAYVEPGRSPSYTGISSAYGFVPTARISEPIHFTDPAMNSSAKGSLLTTYCDVEKKMVFLAAVMEVKDQDRDQAGRDGWRARGRVADEARRELLGRFETEKIPCIAQMTSGVEELFFYPVFTLSNGGQWFKGRAILLGDAAHAMPPGGQSVGLAFEDIIILSRLLSESTESGLSAVFQRYDDIRRPRVEDQYRQAAARWEGTRVYSWWMQWLREFFIWFYLRSLARNTDKNFGYDPNLTKLT